MASNDQLLEALSVPLGSLIASVGRGVAEAQRELDAASLAALRDIYESNEGFFSELQRIGYRPTWYHIPEAEGEIQVALTATGSAGAPASLTAFSPSKVKLYAAPIDAGYASRFGFSLQASSRVKFRVVPVPPSNAAEALRVVPALVGLALGEAQARLSLLGVPADLPDAAPDAVVKAQSPSPGTLLPSDGIVTVETE